MSSRSELLLDARFFEIENLELHLRKRRQLLRGAGEKSGRDIAEDVGMQAALEERENLRSQSAGSGADLQNPQPASFRQTARRRAHGGGDGREPVAGEETVAVELIEQLRRRCRRTGPAPHLFRRAKSLRARHNFLHKAALREDARDASRYSRAESFRRNPRLRKMPAVVCQPRPLFSKEPVPNETGHQALKDEVASAAAIWRVVASKGCARSHTHFAQPARQLRGGQIIQPRAERRLQFG